MGIRSARNLQKVIEFWQTTSVADGYGGNTTSDVIIAKSFASVTTLGNKNSYNSDSFGIIDKDNAILIQLRKRNDITYNALNQFIKYRGEKYIVKLQPTNIDFNDSYIQIIAVKEATKNVNVTAPLLAEGVQQAYSLRCVTEGGTIDGTACLLAYIESIF